MCGATWEHFSSASFCPSARCVPPSVCRCAACRPEDTRSSSPPAPNTPQSFGLLWLVTGVIASHSRCHVFPSDSLSAIGKCSISLVLSLRLNRSSKLRPGTRREAWSIGHTWGRLSLFPRCLLDTARLTQNRQIPFASSERFSFLVAYLSRSVLSCVPVPVSTFSSSFSCFPHVSFLRSFLSDTHTQVTSTILKLFFVRALVFFVVEITFQKR